MADREQPAESSAALSIEALTFRYPGTGVGGGSGPGAGRGSGVLLDIPSFELARGEQALLAGTSGSGKSTLLNLVMGLLEPSSGTVRVAGRNIHGLRGAQRDHFRGAHIGVIFQSYHLLRGFTALENVMAAMAFGDVPKADHEPRARALLDRLGIERAGAMPDALSIGQQQRVAVARALACDPELVLADEPTASLDPENARRAVDLIEEVCRERNAALLCVSHDPSLVGRFARSHTLAELNRASAGGARG